MKIISQPLVSDWTLEHKCQGCDTVLLVEAIDLKYDYYSGDFREASCETFSADCIVCDRSFNINESTIPKLIRLAAKKKSIARL